MLDDQEVLEQRMLLWGEEEEEMRVPREEIEVEEEVELEDEALIVFPCAGMSFRWFRAVEGGDCEIGRRVAYDIIGKYRTSLVARGGSFIGCGDNLLFSLKLC
ncbi:uncharacterized protein MELLADRAFT_101746 [Melampsora larici-populina 98AG31]|uniref:Uncharacterized protein n=1 Tax=Melampsora larici-populina (strain 98AG31 / pathotype 3-4-7) TaxID=747676 RepID=F4R6U1_MELLP|nr:uncharacterized protein MELLADRAFT_101746 [Melampsora larici-populina 98AG31]EGG11931.1 hypothetical protein MELLADRAFT_101746 [Melampsora larici-populina 98AG31]